MGTWRIDPPRRTENFWIGRAIEIETGRTRFVRYRVENMERVSVRATIERELCHLLPDGAIVVVEPEEEKGKKKP
jgi:hypothetical protein